MSRHCPSERASSSYSMRSCASRTSRVRATRSAAAAPRTSTGAVCTSTLATCARWWAGRPASASVASCDGPPASGRGSAATGCVEPGTRSQLCLVLARLGGTCTCTCLWWFAHAVRSTRFRAAAAVRKASAAATSASAFSAADCCLLVAADPPMSSIGVRLRTFVACAVRCSSSSAQATVFARPDLLLALSFPWRVGQTESSGVEVFTPSSRGWPPVRVRACRSCRWFRSSQYVAGRRNGWSFHACAGGKFNEFSSGVHFMPNCEAPATPPAVRLPDDATCASACAAPPVGLALERSSRQTDSSSGQGTEAADKTLKNHK